MNNIIEIEIVLIISKYKNLKRVTVRKVYFVINQFVKYVLKFFLSYLKRNENLNDNAISNVRNKMSRKNKRFFGFDSYSIYNILIKT